MKRKEAFICLGLLLLLIFCFSCSNNKELAEEHYKAGLELARKGETEAALAEYRLALKAYPKHMQANTYYQSYMRYTLNKEDEVFEEYAAKVKKHPRDPVYRYLYARMGDDPDEMAEEAQSIIESKPKFYWGYYLLGSAYRRMNYDDDAIEAFEKAIEVDDTQIGAYSSLASLHATKGDIDKANDCYRQVLDIDSTQIWYHTYIWRNEYNDAEDKEAAKERILGELDAVLEKNPDNISFMSSLRYTLESMGESDRAKEMDAKVIALDSTGNYAAMAGYNQIWQKSSDKERLKEAKAFLEKYPDSDMSQYVYRLLFQFANNIPETTDKEKESIIKRWLEETPNDYNAYNTIAWDYYLKNPKTYAKAVEIARKGVELTPKSRRGPIMDTYGWALVKNKQYEEALKVMLEADSVYGDPDAEVEYHLGEAYYGTGDVDNALDCIVQSLAMKEDKEVLDAYNKVYTKKFGSRKGARTYLNKAVLVAAAVDEPYAAPDFVLTNLKGEEMKLSDHLGKVILVNFWKPG